MKPKAQGPHDVGFLEYLEDIIGTNQYVEKIESTYKEWVELDVRISSTLIMFLEFYSLLFFMFIYGAFEIKLALNFDLTYCSCFIT